MWISNPANSVSTPIAIADGGTGTSTAAGARTNLGLGTLATQNGTIADYAPLTSPTFTGTVTLPTGTSTAAPIKWVAGTNLTTPVAGTIEFDGTEFYLTI